MSEFTDLVAIIVHCVDEDEPLPLHVVVALANGRLEAMWAKSSDPNSMGKLMVLTYAELPAALAVQVAERAAQKIAKPVEPWAEDRIDNILRELHYQLVGTSDNSIREIERDVERYGTTKAISQRQRFAWHAISTAITAVRHETEELEPGYYRYTSGITNSVIDTVYHAWAASVPGEWLADLLRPFGPPSLERIVQRLTR